jgi:hypothetical protein
VKFALVNVLKKFSRRLSAHALGKKLATSTQKIWETRDTFDVIVLYDWNTSSDNFALTKLNKLRSALVDVSCSN